MMRPTLFVQECPTCGRRLLVRIDLMGRTVACQHCQAQFLALDATRLSRGADRSWGPGIMERAQALLDGVQQRSESGTQRDDANGGIHHWSN